MKSMTGYGYKEFQNNKIHFILEIKSFNNRYFDIIMNLPPFLSPFEPKIKDYLKTRVFRGRIEINLRVKELEEDLSVLLDKKVVKSYLGVLNQIREAADIDQGISLSDLISLPGVIKPQKNRDIDLLWNVFLPLLDDCFICYEKSRTNEGKDTEIDILQNINSIKKTVEYISGFSEKMEKRIYTALKDRFTELLGDSVDESRVLAETAVLLVKLTISEEIVRMRSHLSSFLDILSGTGTIGKKLDFICQELNREINTIGSKSTILEISRSVIEVKDRLERIREQVRNVE